MRLVLFISIMYYVIYYYICIIYLYYLPSLFLESCQRLSWGCAVLFVQFLGPLSQGYSL